jgi:hypothetical protein
LKRAGGQRMIKLKPCPFCGSEVDIKEIPLWKESSKGVSHGYEGEYR